LGEAGRKKNLATMIAKINAAALDVMYDAPGHDSVAGIDPIRSVSSQNICRTCDVMIHHAQLTSLIDYNSDKTDKEEIDPEDESVYDDLPALEEDEPCQESGGLDDKVAFEDYHNSVVVAGHDMLIPVVFFIDKSMPDFKEGLTFEPVSFAIQNDK
jgi:hypothetical protein